MTARIHLAGSCGDGLTTEKFDSRRWRGAAWPLLTLSLLLGVVGCGSADTASSTSDGPDKTATTNQFAELIQDNAGLIVTYAYWEADYAQLQRGLGPLRDFEESGRDVVGQCTSLDGKLENALDPASRSFLGVPDEAALPLVELTQQGLRECADIQDPGNPDAVFSGTRKLVEAWRLWGPYGVSQQEDVDI